MANTPLGFYPKPLYTKSSLSFQVTTQRIRETGPYLLWLIMKKEEETIPPPQSICISAYRFSI